MINTYSIKPTLTPYNSCTCLYEVLHNVKEHQAVIDDFLTIERQLSSLDKI